MREPLTAVQSILKLLTSHLGLPHQPELKDVDVASALDGLVPGVVGDVVLFVLLEEVAGAHGVAACQDALGTAARSPLTAADVSGGSLLHRSFVSSLPSL